MDIKRADNQPAPKKRAKYFTRRAVLIVLLLLLAAGWYKSSQLVRGKGYTGLWDFISTYVSNYRHGMGATPETISIEIKDKDLKVLQKKREQAIERGVIINDLDGEYVSATLQYKGQKIKVKLRLKGHMTDHLQEDKWSFRIKIKDKETFMGMKRFTIQHPGTRGYIYEWIYHELMKKEDVIALRYSFINVMVNGKDWGIYAVEENFDAELVENNLRPKAPVLRFNPDLYWVNRYNMMKGTSSVDEFASYYSANAEAYREGNVLEDSTQKQHYLKALAMIEALRSKKISVDQAFDIPRLAKFHAIIDLVGGEHSIDWSDIKYYYNPVTARFEPVAYESFTYLPSRKISGQYRFIEVDSLGNYPDWHTMIFSNKVFYAEYIRQLERISSPSYLDEFFAAKEEQLDQNLRILHKEFPFKKFDRKEYYKRQQMIAVILDPPKAIHAYLKEASSEKLLLQLAPIDALPVEVHGLLVNGIRSVEPGSLILPSKQANTFVSFREYGFSMPPGFVWHPPKADSVTLVYSILGSSRKKTARLFPFPHTDFEFIKEDMKKRTPNASAFKFLTLKDSAYVVNSKNIVLTEDLVIPAGHRLIVPAGTSIDIRNGAGILSYSPLALSGEEDAPVRMLSSDSSSQGIILLSVKETSVFRNVIFRGMSPLPAAGRKRTAVLNCYESPVSLNQCQFLDCRVDNAVSLTRSGFSFKNCLFSRIAGDALDIDFSSGSISSCVVEACGKKAFSLGIGEIRINNVTVSGAKTAFSIKQGAQVKGAGIRVKNAGTAFAVEDGSAVTLDKVQLSDSRLGIAASSNKKVDAHSVITLSALTMVNVKNDYLKEKGVSLTVNGAAVTKEVNDIKEIPDSNEKTP